MRVRDSKSVEEWALALARGKLLPKDVIGHLLDRDYEFIWHPLGFAMCRITRWGAVTLRMHLWPNHKEYQQDPSWLIHDHLFHLKSWVIAGEIENQEYSVTEIGKDHAIYEAYYDADQSILRKTNINCSKLSSRRSVYSTGDVYEVQSGVFHESRSLSEKTAVTVCKTVDQLNRPPRVLGGVAGMMSYSFRRRRATEDEICALIKDI